MKKVLKQLNNQRGVTLLELLAVVIILGVIAAVAVPAVVSQITDSKSEVDATNMAMIKDALERALLKGDIAETDFDIVLDPAGTITGADTANPDLSTTLMPKYLKEVPTIQDTTPGNTYTATIDPTSKVITVTIP